MRQAARQSARLTQCQRLRTASPRPRDSAATHRRSFTASARRFQDSKPPNGSSEHERYLREQREQEKRQQQQQREQQQQQTRDDVDQEAVEENVEPQKSDAEGRKSGLTRKTFRQRRMQEVAKPPPVPDWFVKHNVRLEAERRQEADCINPRSGNDMLLRCVDAETGHTLFTLPYYDAWPASKEGRDVVEGQSSETSKEQAKNAEDGPQSNSTEKPLGSDFFGFRFRPVGQPQRPEIPKSVGQEHDNENSGTPDPQKTSTPTLSAIGPVHDTAEQDSKFNPLKYAFLEIEASARASMFVAGIQRNTSFASGRADLSLVCPDSKSHKEMDEFVHDLASTLQADLVRIDANDLAELADDYVGEGSDFPGSFAHLGYDVFDGYEAVTLRDTHRQSSADVTEEKEMDEEEEEEEEQEDNRQQGIGIAGAFGSIEDLQRALEGKKHDIAKALGGTTVDLAFKQIPHSASARSANAQRQQPGNSDGRQEVQWDNQRLDALLDSLLNAPSIKQASGATTSSTSDRASTKQAESSAQQSSDIREPPISAQQDGLAYQHQLCLWRRQRGYWLPSVATSLVATIQQAPRGTEAWPFIFEHTHKRDVQSTEALQSPSEHRLIVHIRDLQDICSSQLGEEIVKRLVRQVQLRRRKKGQEILIVGTTARDIHGSAANMLEDEDAPFRTIVVPPFSRLRSKGWDEYAEAMLPLPSKRLAEPAYDRILEINLRHIQSMLRRLRPNTVDDLTDPSALKQMNLPGTSILGEKVLSMTQVQRLVLTTIGLAETHAQSDFIRPIHIALSTNLLAKSDHAVQSWQAYKESLVAKRWAREGAGATRHEKSAEGSKEQREGKARIERLKKSCNPHETRLLSGVVDPANIKTAFADVHAPVETIEALKTLTTLSLLRPDAFKYGVLANDRLPGLLLYGPPGTGKTLLAKAVAKESEATVLEVSGAQIYEKYVGEGEKMVKAVFTLARKLSPCIVFVDEADAIFGSRSGAGNRNTHREIINQFLREWDGMDDHSVFMMVASNRPFDLDDAVLRRLPRRLLVDLPTPKDREGILGIHLKHEALDSTVSLANLAEQTPLYSGSDLKNLCVAAALAAVREENDLAVQKRTAGDENFKLPEKRVLSARHFEKAMQEISASISEDMGSLTAIRKFDEQFGDRRGRRKKSAYGFGELANDGKVDESAVRVRQAEQQASVPPPPPPSPSPPPPA